MMNQRERQEKEIKTIKERTIKIRLSDADCDRIAKRAAIDGISVGQLIENFIGDLVNGTYSNGSDERLFAKRWHDRCWFGMFPENTLLRYLVDDMDYDVDDFLTAWDEKKYAETHPEEFAKERAELAEGEKLWFDEEVDTIVGNWLPNEKTNVEEQIEICRKWLEELESIKG